MKCRLVLFFFVTHFTVQAAEPTYRAWKDEFKTMQLMGVESRFVGGAVPTYQQIFTLHLEKGEENHFTFQISPTRNTLLIQIKTPTKRRGASPHRFGGVICLSYIDEAGGEKNTEYFSFTFTDPHEKMLLKIPTMRGLTSNSEAYYLDKHELFQWVQWKDLSAHNVTLQVTGSKSWSTRSVVVNLIASAQKPNTYLLQEKLFSYKKATQ